MAVPKYRLIYFNTTILGEPIRLLLNYVGAPFEDVRINSEEKWAELKQSTGWGKIPVLEIDGKQQISQSIAIAKYLGTEFNLDGVNSFESAKCLEYAGVTLDLRTEWRKYWFEADEAKRQKGKKDFLEIAAPTYFTKFIKILENNRGKYLVGNGITWSDLFFVAFLELFETTVDKNILIDYHVLLNYKTNIFSIPQIKKYVESRPPNDLIEQRFIM